MDGRTVVNHPPQPHAVRTIPMIREFQGPYWFLSNFWPAAVVLDGIEYPTVEHAYQAAKTLDPALRLRIRAAATPGEAKRLSRAIPRRLDWDEVRLAVMAHLVQQKFARHPRLADQLIGTYPHELQEGNRWGDVFFGVDLRTGRGFNHLGKILERVREDLILRAEVEHGRQDRRGQPQSRAVRRVHRTAWS